MIEELDSWIDDNWNEELSVSTWWDHLGRSGWAAPTLPTSAYGRGLSRSDGQVVARRLKERNTLGAPSGLGMLLAAPTIAMYGTEDQVEELVLPIVTGRTAWCQLFSEPGAGSDLAGISTRAVLTGDEWLINGQKVWTSSAHLADMGMLLARTDPSQGKHQGISWLAIDMHQGTRIDVRPLREMTGRSQFSEVFLTDARSPKRWVVGGVNKGWKVATATLGFERSGLGAGSAGGNLAAPGSRVGNLDKPVAAFGTANLKTGRDGAAGMVAGAHKHILETAAKEGRLKDPVLRDRLARLYAMNEVSRIFQLRVKAERGNRRKVPGAANISKLWMSEIAAQTRDVGMSVLGAHGLLHPYDGEARASLERAIGCTEHARVTELALFASASRIYGGTDEIQKNIIAERVLGLPRLESESHRVPSGLSTDVRDEIHGASSERSKKLHIVPPNANGGSS
jgi:alkylation response protein AidB-like acyl-CoA dehydrogenase